MIKIRKIGKKFVLEKVTIINNKQKNWLKYITTTFIILFVIFITSRIFYIDLKDIEKIGNFFFPKSDNVYTSLISTSFKFLTLIGVIVTLILNFNNLYLFRLQLKTQMDGTDISRFESGYKLLHSNSENEKIGGIYLLHEIAKNSLTLRKSVFEILCNYLRDHSKDEVTKYKSQIDYIYPESLQKILDLVFKEENNEIYEKFIPKLKGTIFIDADLSFSNYRKADFTNCQFIRCNFEYSNFVGTKFTNVRLSNSSSSKMTSSNFCYANFNKCYFDNISLNPMILFGTGFHESSFKDCLISFGSCELTHTRFVKSKFNCCYFNESIFISCVFNEVVIENSLIDKFEFKSTYVTNLVYKNNFIPKDTNEHNKYSKMNVVDRIEFIKKLNQQIEIPKISLLSKRELKKKYKSAAHNCINIEMNYIGGVHTKTKELLSSRGHVFMHKFKNDKYMKIVLKRIKFSMISQRMR